MTGRYVTASRLNDGTVVWLTTQQTWSEQFEAAGCFESEAFPAALQTAEDAQAAREVIDVHAAPAPLTYREQIRAFGPSVRDDLGTQSQHMPRPVPLPSRLYRVTSRILREFTATMIMIVIICARAWLSSANRSNVAWAAH